MMRINYMLKKEILFISLVIFISGIAFSITYTRKTSYSCGHTVEEKVRSSSMPASLSATSSDVCPTCKAKKNQCNDYKAKARDGNRSSDERAAYSYIYAQECD